MDRSADQKQTGNKEKMGPKNNYEPPNGSGNVDADLQEMQDVNEELDQLESALDFFEQKTDNIIQQLKELLDSNREIRQQLALENAAVAANKSEEQEQPGSGAGTQ